jgi:hypothetical protein
VIENQMLEAPKATFRMTRDEIKSAATAIADELRKTSAANAAEVLPAGGGSRQRGLPEELRKRFIDVRAALFERGIFNPVLVRFDSASAPPATTPTVADALAAVAASL